MKKLILLLNFIILTYIFVGCCSSSYRFNHPHEEFLHHLNNSTVALLYRSDPTTTEINCSGVWISETHIVTARHCVEDDNNNISHGSLVEFITYNEFSNDFPNTKEPKATYFAIVVADQTGSDLAILKTVNENIPHHIATITTNINIGEETHILGHPVGLPWTYMTGVISQVREVNLIPMIDRDGKFIHMTSLVNFGNSGGPAFDSKGNIVGIASFIKPNTPGVSFFIHSDELIKLLEKENIKYFSSDQ